MLKNKNYNTAYNIWLISLIILLSLIVIIGGLTRLTDSGLSITKWELFRGILPPITSKDWIDYFESYKKIPQYSLLNNSMSLDEFKYIFFWEYAHRLLARFIGLFFLIPFLFFIFMNVLTHNLTIQLSKVFILILLQGIIGWYMVTSGLVENTSVSHYRLSIHLLMAFSILSSLLWIFLNSFFKTEKKFFQLNFNDITLKILLFLMFIQIIFGAFVSGLDAGKVYQTWPLMNQSYFPDDASLGNLFNLSQPSIVQFFHRNIAYLIFFLSIGVGFNIFIKKKAFLYRIFLFFFLTIITQVILGISVLITGVNLYLASMHQISSIFLIVAAINLYYRSIRY